MKFAVEFSILLATFLAMFYEIHGLVFSRTQDICKHEDYLTPAEAPITCCSKERLTPGISYEKYWNECATPNDSEEMINVTLWRVYNCIVKKSLNEKSLTLENFATEMTKNYPEEKKKSILKSVGANENTFQGDESELDRLRMIRSKYYNIELNTCSTNASAIRDQMEKYPSYNKWYVRGSHCLNGTVPIDPNYYPLADDKDIVETWKTLLETVSVNDNKTHGVEIQKACEIPSSWVAQELATADELFQKPDFQKILERIKPKWANKKVAETLKKQIDEYWITAFPVSHNDESSKPTLEEHAITQMDKFYETVLKSEFVGIRDEVKAKALMTFCMTQAFMKTSMAESFTYLLCRLPKNI